jgi:hypothetical protein
VSIAVLSYYASYHARAGLIVLYGARRWESAQTGFTDSEHDGQSPHTEGSQTRDCQQPHTETDLQMKRRSVLTGAAAVVLAGAIGGGAAYAASSPAPQVAGAPTAQLIRTTGSVTNEAADKTPQNVHPRLARARRVVHGQFTVKTKNGFRTVLTQRGEISAVSPTSLTVTSPDHYAHTYALGSSTRVRKDKQKSTISKLAKGDHVRVITSPQHGTSSAAVVIDRTK